MPGILNLMKATLPLCHGVGAVSAIAASFATSAVVVAGSEFRSAFAKILASFSHGCSFDYGALGHLFQVCADHRLYFKGRLLHGRLILLSVVPGNFLGSKIMSFYSKCGRIDEARKVFDRIPCKNVFSFNAMLIAYSIHDQHFKSVNLFADFVNSNPDLAIDAYSISAVLKCLSSLSSSSRISHLLGQGVHGFVLRRGIYADLFVSNGLVTLYAKLGYLDLARKVFDRMVDRDIVSWNAMISAYDQGGRYEECIKLFQQLEGPAGGDLRPDCVTAVSVIHACSQVKDLSYGARVHRSLAIHGVEIDTQLRNSLLGLYARCGRLEFAGKLFEEMIEKDEVTYGTMINGYMSYGFVDKGMNIFHQISNPLLTNWNAVISGLVQNNRHVEVLQIFRELQSSGLRPNSVTLSSILPTISSLSNLLAGRQIHGYSIKKHCDQNVYVMSGLIDMYAKAGFVACSCRIFRHSSSRSVILWTAIISAYAAQGDADKALSLFQEMLSERTLPDAVTFTTVLSACAHAGAVSRARRIFDSMMDEYGIEPSMEQYACMAGVLSRAGMLDEALRLTQKMPHEPNAKVWGALLSGASIHRKVGPGEYAFERLLEIEPENIGNYIVMANLYTQAGNVEGAEGVREKMRKMGLGRKIPGCSWVEMADGLHPFVAQDMSNAKSKELSVMLDGLTELMRERYYITGQELQDEDIYEVSKKR
ncbi:pentatricopeptide repeat (PPR) superfamily protein [Wolffia australiana]